MKAVALLCAGFLVVPGFTRAGQAQRAPLGAAVRNEMRWHPAGTQEAPMALSLSSPAFPPNGDIPRQYTCDGKDQAPPLAWSGAPAGTKSLALIVDDPDAPDPKAPKTTWVHWVVYDIPPSVAALPEAASAKSLPPGAREGVNDWKRVGYGGPCPPIGRHRYFHKLYALDASLGDLGRPTKAALERAMERHILAKSELVGTYQRAAR